LFVSSAALFGSLGCSSSSPGTADPFAGCSVPAAGLPTDLYCTGLYANRSTDQLASGVMPYTPGVVLWSDGAEKHRFLSLPAGSKIDTSDLEAWRFPVGTKAWKEFRFDGALVETRLFWKRSADSWDSGTYIWAADGTATLNTSAPKGVILPSGYEIPTQKDCDKCHHGGADKLLGIEAVALALPDAAGETLTALAKDGWLSEPPTETAKSLPEDATGKAAAALGYLHANCGMPCHSSRGLGDETMLVMRIRATELWPATGNGPVPIDMTDVYRATVNQTPTTQSVIQKYPGALRVTPGAHDQSLLWLLSHLRGKYQMPPLVSHLVDDAGTQRLADWIDALPQ
jgi:hypothetical protein